MVEDAAPAPGERGWRLVLLALAAFLLLPFLPQMRGLLPIVETPLLLIPILASCALLGWWQGGRLVLAVGWIAVASWLLAHPLTASPATYDRLTRGWSLLLAASFGVVCVFSPGHRFFSRALATVALACAAAAGAVGVSGSSVTRVRTVFEDEYTARTRTSLASLDSSAMQADWRAVAAKHPSIESLRNQSVAQLRALPHVSSTLLPAFMALESLAALSLAWSLYHRLSRARLGAALSPLREFRFNDQLVWGVIVGATLVLLPAFDAWRTPGFNLLLFFGVLYALRGCGVLSWALRGRTQYKVLLSVAFLVFPPLGAFAFALGLGDTWVDWRNRARPTT